MIRVLWFAGDLNSIGQMKLNADCLRGQSARLRKIRSNPCSIGAPDLDRFLGNAFQAAGEFDILSQPCKPD
jgi:hypothetical protein